jgi:hypothetical protein
MKRDKSNDADDPLLVEVVHGEGEFLVEQVEIALLVISQPVPIEYSVSFSRPPSAPIKPGIAPFPLTSPPLHEH